MGWQMGRLGAGVLLAVIAIAAPTQAGVVKVERQPTGITVTLDDGVVRLQVMSESVVRVTYAAGATVPELKSLSVIATPSADAKWKLRDTPDAVVIETSKLRAKVDRKTGAVGFFDLKDAPILQETPNGREISPAIEPGVVGTLVRQSFVLPADEGIYGLGQHQQGIWNYRGHTVRLLQENMEVGIPMMLSSRGYCLLWDNPAVTEVSVGAPVPTTAPTATAAPTTASTKPSTRPKKTPPPPGAGENVVRWSSDVGHAVDYYFMYGPSPEQAIASYRAITGPAPLMPKWLLGFWQCKERYRTQEEMLSIAKEYRDRQMPIDGIIQDWRYWPDDTWGSHNFDKERYPDPASMVKQLHAMNYHMLISVWPKFDLGTPNIEELEKAGAMYEPVIPYVYPKGQGKWYDPFSAKGREVYWKQISQQIFSMGWDGWWLDAPEPELAGNWGEFRHFKTAMGPGAEVFNAYPLMHSTGIYTGQRAQTNDQRVVILTRSAYAGQQRNSAITWSGDVGSNWTTLRNQIPAGLNFAVSGIPYWNTDIGGFYGSMNPQDPKYQEVFTRWFQFGSFCPMFRVHGGAPNYGTGTGKEFWRFDEATQKTWRTFVEMRYRLMPYTYSVTWQVTSAGSTIMRPLVMDFSDDRGALDIGNQFLFGPSIMVNPVATQGATTRPVYLPGKDTWYDFWTGKTLTGGQTVDAPAPLSSIPIYVRAGAIVPMGPMIQYTSEKPADPIELRVYRGADGSFTLYEDEGDSYRYENGAYATIPMTWSESTQTLTIGKRSGEFTGMVKERTFNVVFADERHGNGVGVSEQVDKTVKYTGDVIAVIAKK